MRRNILSGYLHDRATINKHKDPTKQLDLNNHYQNSTQNIKRTPVTVMEYNLDV